MSGEADDQNSKLQMFEDNMSAYHPAYAFKKTGKGLINDKIMLVTTFVLILCMLFDWSPLVVYSQMGIMIGINLWIPSNEPQGTDALKVESYLSKLISKGPFSRVSYKARKAALKSGGIPCEKIKYIP